MLNNRCRVVFDQEWTLLGHKIAIASDMDYQIHSFLPLMK